MYACPLSILLLKACPILYYDLHYLQRIFVRLKFHREAYDSLETQTLDKRG